MKELIQKLSKIQAELKAPKSQYNNFGKYSYRNCEDILEAVKPMLNGLVLTISDDIQVAGDRVYIKATATITNGVDSISNSALAREAITKKGMDDSQITGSTSSYARKYALNGLFCIDDTKDADSSNLSIAPATTTATATASNSSINKTHPVAQAANDFGYTLQEVFNTFDPPITSLREIQDPQACVEWLKQNRRKA